MDDVDDENLISWFTKANRFIEEGLRPIGQARNDVLESRQETLDHNDGNSGVLVHW